MPTNASHAPHDVNRSAVEADVTATATSGPTELSDMQRKLDASRAERARLAAIALKKRSFVEPRSLDETPAWLTTLQRRKEQRLQQQNELVTGSRWLARLDQQLVASARVDSAQGAAPYSSGWLRALDEELQQPKGPHPQSPLPSDESQHK